MMPYMDEWEYLIWLRMHGYTKDEKLPENDQTDSPEDTEKDRRRRRHGQRQFFGDNLHQGAP